MSHITLTNTSTQVETTISQSYCRLTGSFVGPLTASVNANCGFLIQNGNKQSGLFVGNTCVAFYNNCLNFDAANTDVSLNIPDTKNFIITGNASLLTFNAQGTLAVGATIDTNYRGVQVVNTCPVFLLKDSDNINRSGCQGLLFLDSVGTVSTSFCNEPSSAINTGLAITDNATNIGYNKYFKLRNNVSTTNSLVLCDNNLTLFSGNCLNRSFNFAVGGTSYFACDLCSSGSINAAGLCVFSNNSFLSGSGDNVAFHICNNKSNSSGSINFYNLSGGLHSYILSNQSSGLGCSEIDFYVTPVGAYNSTNRNQLALEIKGDRSANFYGNISASTGFYSSFIRSSGIQNSGCRTFLAPGSDGFHYFGSSTLNCAYGISIDANNRILNHRWLTSGRASMCLDFNQNLTVTGCLLSSGINSTSALIVNNINDTDSCIRSRCIIFCANGSNQNIINCGNFINYGSRAIFSGICSTGKQDNFISGCLCVQDNVYTNCVCLTAGGGVCGPLGCFTSCVQSQVVCSNSCVRGDSICSTGVTNLNCFNSSICTNGFVAAQNTTKAWGHFELIDGVGSICCGYNFNSLIVCCNSANTNNFLYGLKLNTGIRYPFSLQMSVMPKGTFGWSTTAGNVIPFTASTQNFAIPICSGINTATNPGTAQAYVAGTTYCELFFIILNCKGLGTTFSELTKANFDANIMFSIYSF